MRNKWMTIFTALLILLFVVTPALAAPENQSRGGDNSGNSPGYYIWQDGDRWYLEVANNEGERQFTGSIQTNGEFVQVRALATEQTDRIHVDAERNRIGFRFQTRRENDGLSFTVSDGAMLNIALYIDGQPVDPSRIHLGRRNQSPDNNPFRINLHGDLYGPGSRINYTGRPTMFDPGNSLGYFIWQDGDRWYIETTANGREQNFKGIIETQGKFADIRTVAARRSDRVGQSPLEKIFDLAERNIDANNDRVTVNSDNNRINISFRTAQEADGISFTLRDSEFMKFTLYIDGQVIDPSRVYLGRQNRNPGENPFRIVMGDAGYAPHDHDNYYQGRPAGFDPGQR
ncbi:MAG: hypothetical protein P4N59_23140 [Negativicutes bacterium]|nr:hypothetical protein [Negativicutes bacterium]